MRWHHTELAKTSDEGYYDKYGFRVPDEHVEQWSFHHQHNKCRARWQYVVGEVAPATSHVVIAALCGPM